MKLHVMTVWNIIMHLLTVSRFYHALTRCNSHPLQNLQVLTRTHASWPKTQKRIQLDTDSLEFIIIYYLNFIKRTRITTNKTHLHVKMLIFRRFLPSSHINFALQDIQHKCLSIIMIHTLLIKTGRITSKRSRYILKAPAPVHTTNLLSATRLISARHGSPCRDLP
jgi:hypothetical protein